MSAPREIWPAPEGQDGVDVLELSVEKSERKRDLAPETAPNQDATYEGGSALATGKSSKSPAFQFYPSDFIGSSKVQRMPLAERGAYITLLSFAWLDHGLPTDMGELGRMVGLSKAAFTKMWNSQLHKCFVERSGKFVNLRQEDIRKAQAEYRKRQRDNAAKGWQSRGNTVASERHMPNGCSPSPTPSPSPSLTPVNTHREDAGPPETPFASPSEGPSHPFAAWLRELCGLYPAHRRLPARNVERLFIEAFWRHADTPPPDLFVLMKAGLALLAGSTEWRRDGGRYVPRLDNWLTADGWERKPPADVAETPAIDPKLPKWAQQALAEKAARKETA